MRCVGEAGLAVAEYSTLDGLPDGALALFGADIFSTEGWYASVLSAGLPQGARACFQVVSDRTRVLAACPMLRLGQALCALTTPYTCLWQPLLAPGLTAGALAAIGRALARHWRGAGVVRLDAMAQNGLAGVSAGLRAGGLRVLPFDHFGNWYLPDIAGWEPYLAARPGQLRTAIGRYTRRLMGGRGAEFRLVNGAEGLQAGIAGYETVYAASWKDPEPFPRFNATLMRACAAEGTLRLGLILAGGVPVAAQFWVLRDGCASVLKLAHDEAWTASAPGTVLSALMVRHLLEVEHAHTLDFGRGDDAYKQLWTGVRRQRVGALVVSPWSVSGALEIGRRVGKESFGFLKKKRHKNA